MAREQEIAPTELHELVVLLVERLAKVGRTRLTKLLYLIDVAHFARHGTTLTGGNWVRYTQGPMLYDLPRITRELEDSEIRVEEYVDDQGIKHADYLPGEHGRFRPQLRKHELGLVEEVLSRYGKLPLAALKRVAYATPPMRLILQWEREGERLDGTAIPFARALGSPSEGLSRYRRVADAIREHTRGAADARASLEAKALRETAGLRKAAMSEELAGRRT